MPTVEQISEHHQIRLREALKEPEIVALAGMLKEASSDLTAYVDADYPPYDRVRYPAIARRYHRDLELVRRIDATLASLAAIAAGNKG